MQCNRLQCSAVPCRVVQCSAVQWSELQCIAVQCSAVQCSFLPSRWGWGGSSDAINSACGTGHSQNTCGTGGQLNGQKNTLSLALSLSLSIWIIRPNQKCFLIGFSLPVLTKVTSSKFKCPFQSTVSMYKYGSNGQKLNVSWKAWLTLTLKVFEPGRGLQFVRRIFETSSNWQTWHLHLLDHK